MQHYQQHYFWLACKASALRVLHDSAPSVLQCGYHMPGKETVTIVLSLDIEFREETDSMVAVMNM